MTRSAFFAFLLLSQAPASAQLFGPQNDISLSILGLNARR